MAKVLPVSEMLRRPRRSSAVHAHTAFQKHWRQDLWVGTLAVRWEGVVPVRTQTHGFPSVCCSHRQCCSRYVGGFRTVGVTLDPGPLGLSLFSVSKIMLTLQFS